MSPMSIELLTTLATSDLIRSLLDRRLNEAKKVYQVSEKDVTSPLERKRNEILAKLTELQTKIILNVTGETQLLRLLPILKDQTIKTYEATTDQELKLIELSIGQIEGFLARHEQIAEQRRQARTRAIIFSIIAIGVLIAIIIWGEYPGGPSNNTVLPIIQIPLPILLWSAVGSFVAILYRFNKSGDIELQDPLRWLFTRPITGVVMGVVAYFMLSIGFLAAGSKDISSVGTAVVFWLVAFISGFSDRFADGLLKTLIGRFGGDDKSDIVTLSNFSSSDLPSLTSLFDSLPVVRDWGNQHRTGSLAKTNGSGASKRTGRKAATPAASNSADQNGTTPAASKRTGQKAATPATSKKADRKAATPAASNSADQNGTTPLDTR